jgi:hypothetical protein
MKNLKWLMAVAIGLCVTVTEMQSEEIQEEYEKYNTLSRKCSL